MTDQRHAVHLTCLFHVDSPLDIEGFHAHGERVMDHLLELENDDLTDSDVGTDAAARTIRVGVLVYGEDHLAGIAKGLGAVRTAVHAAGGSTTQWPNLTIEHGGTIAYGMPKLEYEPALV